MNPTPNPADDRTLDIGFGVPMRFTCSCGHTETFDRAAYDAQPYGFARRWLADHPHVESTV